VLIAVGGGLLACLMIGLHPRQATAPGHAWAASLGSAAALIAVVQGIAGEQTARLAWRLMAIGLGCQTLSHLARGLTPFAADARLFTLWAIVAQVLATTMLVAGLIAFRTTLQRTTARIGFALDAAGSLLAGATLSWYLMRLTLPVQDVADWFRSSPLLLVVPGLQLLAVTAATQFRLLRDPRGLRSAMGVVAAGLAGQFLCHSVLTWWIPDRAVLLTIGDGVSTTLLLLGIVMQVNTVEVDVGVAAPLSPPTIFGGLLPHLPVLAGSLMLFHVAVRNANYEATAFVAMMLLMTLLVVARQAIAVRVRAQRSMARATEDSEARLQTIVQYSSDLITIVDDADTVRYVSPAISSVFGHLPSAVEGRPLREFVHPDDVVHVLTFLDDASKPESVACAGQWRQLHGSGAWHRVEAVAMNLLSDTTIAGIVLTTRDITHRVALEEQLVHRAFHDEMTGLANRALFTDRVEQAMLRASRDAQRTAVLFLDLDDFKEVNDSLGHAAGDALLQQGADRLRACLRSGDTAARLGGDEFAVLLEGCVDDGAEATRVAERISNAFARPFSLEGREVFATASIGMVVSDGGESGDDLLRNADLAMYIAKKRGKARLERFESHMHEEVVERLDLLADLRHAIEREELQLEYQPIIDLESRTVSGLETLVRWDHPRRGRISPLDFIPLAEQSGLIVAIGRWVMLHACSHARHWSRSLPELVPVTVTVNLSARQLGDEHLLDDVATALRVAGLRRNQLVLELTESTLLANSEETVEILNGLKSLGVRLAIDDFGTGYSSLSYLHRFPVDVLKIDKSFVDGIDSGPGASALASAVIALGNSLGLRTVAEGIETDSQLSVLAGLGCKFGQGFLFSRPLPPDAVMPFLQKHGQRATVTAAAARARNLVGEFAP